MRLPAVWFSFAFFFASAFALGGVQSFGPESARLLHEEHAGWRALCEGRAAEYYYRVMTRDAVMLLPGRVLDRGTILASLEGVPPWDSYEIHDPRVVRLPGGGGILFYRALARRGGAPSNRVRPR